MSVLIILADPESMSCGTTPHYLVPASELTSDVDRVLAAMDGNYERNHLWFDRYDAVVVPFLRTLVAQGKAAYRKTRRVHIDAERPVSRVIMLCCGPDNDV